MDYKKFFDTHGEWGVSGGNLTVEQLYQAFAARYRAELSEVFAEVRQRVRADAELDRRRR